MMGQDPRAVIYLHSSELHDGWVGFEMANAVPFNAAGDAGHIKASGVQFKSVSKYRYGQVGPL